MLRGPPISTRADTLFPYTPLFRAQAHGFAAIGRAVRTAFDLGLERSAQRGVDGVAHAGRAVVGEVVVAVARVLRLCVLGQRRCQARGFGVAEVAPLDRHAADRKSAV